ncbi:MAG: hypothetical protein CMF55_02400 [Legionellales bacterium]|nr:hypothetical protein [Legionellales bacterium]
MGKASRSNYKSNRPSKVKGTLFKARPDIYDEFNIMIRKITDIRQTDSTCKKNERSYSEGNVNKYYREGKELQVKLKAKRMNKYVKTLAKELHMLKGFMKRFSHAEEKSTCSLS